MDSSRVWMPRLRSGLLWTAMVLGGLIALMLVALLLIDWNAFKGPIERLASDRSGRVVRIEGPLEVDVWSWTPTVALRGLVVGNPPWEAGKPFVRIERLNASLKLPPLLKGDVILPRLELIRPEVYLHRDPSGRANWTFESTRPRNAPAGPPPDLPVVRDFLIQEGKLTVHDELLRLEMHGVVQAREQSSQDDPEAFRITGDGTLNKKPFAVRVAGGPLVNLQPDHPYRFDMRLKAGDIDIRSDGRVLKPFDLGKVSLNVRAKGGDLADLYYLTHLAFPNTPPFDLAAHVDRDDSNIQVKDIAGKVGGSDMRGELSIDASRKRPFVKGRLVAERLRMKDLAASVGAKPKSNGTLQGGTEAPKPSKRGSEQTPPPQDARLFPSTHLQVERVRAMDADVQFSAQSIEAGPIPLKQVSARIGLNEGLLTLDPLQLEMPQGKLHGTVHLDARKNTPLTRIDLHMTDMQLDQFKGKAPNATPPLTGALQARAHLTGVGDSLHDFMADARGQVSMILPEGEVREAFAELTGINVARGLGLLMSGSEDRAPIRCGVAQFNVENGVMTADNVVFDTEKVRITGQGEVRLGPEELDLSIKGQPKKLRLLRLRTPIKINGHLRKPSIGVDAGKTLQQGAIASALAALTPVAAIIAFVDPGLAKDENCAALLADSTPPNAKRARLDGESSRLRSDHR